MIGIYAIRRNGQYVYVGQSINIARRWSNHRKDRPDKNENYSYSVLEECAQADLDEREIYWTSKLDTYHNGENKTPGGINPFNDPATLAKQKASLKALYKSPKGKEKARRHGEMMTGTTRPPRPDNAERNKKIHTGKSYRKGATNTPEQNKIISEKITEHWKTRSRTLPDEQKQKISYSLKKAYAEGRR